MNKKKQAQVFHFDLFGSRNDKYDFLNNNSIASIAWNDLELKEPNLFFTKKDFQAAEDYEKGFKVDDLYISYSSGIKTHDDKNLISSSKFGRYNHKYFYRPFDIKNIDYDLSKVVRHRFSFMRNMLCDNLAILFPRQAITERFGFFVSKGLTDINYTGTAGQFGAGLVFPLYLYPESSDQQTLDQQQERIPNLNPKIVQQLAKATGLTFTPEVEDGEFTFAPLDILDYIYAVLHSPAYRAKYKEFLKIDFPRVPYPKNTETFWQLVKLGGELRQIHLLESPTVEQPITSYPEAGTNEVDKPQFKMYDYDCTPPGEEHPDYLGDVYINSTQYFAKVPQSAWEFYIGGYQPAQKWLKDRKGRTLSFHDIEHYQKIIVALTETGRLMKEIDLVGVE